MEEDDFELVDELPAPPRKDIAPADLELLHLAARALGAEFVEVDGEGYGNLHFPDGTVKNAWNPLDFSDDAFDLGVRLGLFNENAEFTYLLAEEIGPSEHRRDPVPAARRAATRAAAEIGKAI